MKLFYLTLALFSIQFAHSQLSSQALQELLDKGTMKELVQANTDLMIQGMFFQAMQVSDKMLVNDPDNSNFNYRKARTMIAMSRAPEKVLPFLLKGASQTNRIYDALSHTEKNAPNDVFYWLARTYHQIGDLDNAEATYQKYLDVEVFKSVELRKFAQNGLQQVANARREIATPRNYTIKNAGPSLNTAGPEYSSYVSLDGMSIYYTTRRVWANEANAGTIDPSMNLPWESIYMSVKNGEAWGTPQLLEFCLPENNYASVSVSKDERIIYTYNDKVANGDIYMSNLIDGQFKVLEALTIPRINTMAWEPHFVISHDGKTIYFVSDRKGGLGGRDIWKIEKMADGQWSREPKNLGPEINSPFDEDSPFIALDGRTLFYSTNGPKSTGGFDIVKAVMNNDGSFSSSENIGYPLNSTSDDIFFSTVGSGEVGYFTSSRKDGFGSKDLYMVTMPNQGIIGVAMLKANIKTKDGSPIPNDISAKLVCSNCSEDGEKETLPRLRDGVLISPLEKGKSYELVYMQAGSELHTEKFATSNDEKFQQIDLLYIIGVGPVSQEYVIAGTVKDGLGKPVEGVSVELVSLTGSDIKNMYTTNPDGKFTADVLKGYPYGTEVTARFTLTKDGYIVQTVPRTFKLGMDKFVPLSFTFIADTSVGPIDPPVIGLGIIYYDLNKSDIRDDAEIELNKIVKLMNDNPEMVIELTSHTDCRSSSAYNQALSDRRAQAAVKYIRKGLKVNPKRITGKGMGESQIKNKCKCECEQSAQEIGADKYKDCENQQAKDCSEAQHQENRRTEFRIVSNGNKDVAPVKESGKTATPPAKRAPSPK